MALPGGEPRAGDGRPISSFHAELATILRPSLPPTAVSLFARPQHGGGHLEWYTDLPGHAVLASKLPSAERARLERLLAERLGAMRDMADRLAGSGRSGAAEMVRLAARPLAVDDLYAVGGQPVLVNWHVARAATLPVPPGPAPAPASPQGGITFGTTPAASVPPGTTVAGSASTAGSVAGGARTLGWWLARLLPALVLLLLLAVLLRGCAPLGLAPVIRLPGLGLPSPGPEDLDAEIRRLEEALQGRLASCPAPATPPQDAPAPAMSPIPGGTPAPAVPAPDAAGTTPAPPSAAAGPSATPQSPAQAAPTPPASPPSPAPSPTPQPSSPPQARSGGTAPGKSASLAKPPSPPPCPPPRPAWEAPEVVVVLDGSGSMAIPAQFPKDQARELLARAMTGDAAAQAALAGMRGAAARDSRLGLVQDALARTVPTLPPEVSAGFVVFGDCVGADNYRFFSKEERPRLLELLRTVKPRDGTPLARGLQRAGAMVDGRDVPAVIVVVSDGLDSCGGDPCATARRLKAEKPKLTINYVDASGTGEARCIADATGGKVMDALGTTDLDALFRQAYEQPVVPLHCQGG